MWRTVRFFVGHLLPRRGLQYFREYLEEVSAINRARELGADAERRHVTAKHWASIVFFLAHSFHNLWLLSPARLSNRQILVHYDLPIIEFGSVVFNVVWIAFGPLCVMLHSDGYLRTDDRLLHLIDAILFRPRISLFASNRFRVTTPFNFLHNCAIVITKFMNTFIVLLHFVYLFYHIFVMNKSFDTLQVSFDNSPLDLFCYRANAFKYHAFLFELANTLILAGAISALVSISNYVMFKLANQVLLGPHQYSARNVARRLAADWRRFDRFRRHLIDALRNFSIVNAWMGQSFTAFLIVNFPLNAYLVMFLLTSDLPTSKKMAPILLVIAQLWALFGMHLALSMFSSLIHRPCKPSIGLMVRQHIRLMKIIRNRKRKRVICQLRSNNNYLHNQIRLSLFVDAFHSTNRYGQTYGKCGLITIATFIKCLMFYGKFVMISYKNIRKIK